MRRPFAVLAAVLAVASLAGCAEKSTAPIVIPPLSAVVIQPDSGTVLVGSTFDFDATAYDTLGAPVPDVPLHWTTGDALIFTVNALGTVRGVGEGSAPLFVEVGGMRDTAWVTVAFADTGWFVQLRDASGADFNGVSFHTDGRTGAVVGEAGRIVRTTNAGATWSTAVSNTSFNLEGVWFTSSVEAWAVGAGGTVLHTLNAGANWTRLLNVPTAQTLYDVHFATRDTGWVVGAAGVVLRTFNRGASWQLLVPTINNLRAVSFAGTRDGWAVGENGVILGTHDRGLSWFTVLPSITGSDLMAVSRLSEPRAWAVGLLGIAPRTIVTPDSTAWELRNAGASNQLEGVWFVSDLRGFAVGSNSGIGGTVLRTDDGGVSWTPQPSHVSEDLRDVFFVDPERGWAVGENGVVLHTSRAGGS